MRPSLLSPMPGGTLHGVSNGRLAPFGRKGTLGASKAGSQSVAAAPGEPHTEAAASSVNSNSSSDRAKIAMLKSDINLVQSEIDAFRGDPGGILNLQSSLEKLQWSVDPVASSVVRDQLSTILLKKLNELAATCEDRCFRSKNTNTHSALLLPRHSFVAELASFFQNRRLGSLSSSGALAAPTPASKILSTPVQQLDSSLSNKGPATPSSLGPLLPHSVAMATSSPAPSPQGIMAAEDPDDAFPLPAPQHRVGDIDDERPSHSPIDDLSNHDGDDDDGVCWAPQSTSNANDRATQQRSNFSPSDSPLKRHSGGHSLTVMNSSSSGAKHAELDAVAQEKITKLARQLEQVKAQLRFFKTVDKHLMVVHQVSEQLQLLAASPPVEVLHTSLSKAIETFYPQGVAALSAAIKSANAANSGTAAPAGSPGKKGSRKEDILVTSNAPTASSTLPATVLLASLLAGPVDEKKLRIAVAYQNAVIESLTSNLTVQAAEDKVTIAQLNEHISTLQKRLMAQSQINFRDRAAAEQLVQRLTLTGSRLATPALGSTTSSAIGAFMMGGALQASHSRPLSRASIAESGGLVSFFGARATTPALNSGSVGLLLPPRPSSDLAVLEVRDQPDVFASHHAPEHHRRPRPLASSENRSKPLVATRAEDIDGEKERRYLQVIRSQSDIIKDLSNKISGKNSAAASTTGNPLL